MNKQYDRVRELLDRAWAIANDRQSDHEPSDDRNSNYQMLEELLVAINWANDRLDNARLAFVKQPDEAY